MFLELHIRLLFSKKGQLIRNGHGLQQKPFLAEQRGENTHTHTNARTSTVRMLGRKNELFSKELALGISQTNSQSSVLKTLTEITNFSSMSKILYLPKKTLTTTLQVYYNSALPSISVLSANKSPSALNALKQDRGKSRGPAPSQLRF